MTRPPLATPAQKRALDRRHTRAGRPIVDHFGAVFPSAPPSEIDLLEREASECRALAASGFMAAEMFAQAREVEMRIAKLRRKTTTREGK